MKDLEADTAPVRTNLRAIDSTRLVAFRIKAIYDVLDHGRFPTPWGAGDQIVDRHTVLTLTVDQDSSVERCSSASSRVMSLLIVPLSCVSPGTSSASG
jgi:hypothetical protein